MKPDPMIDRSVSVLMPIFWRNSSIRNTLLLRRALSSVHDQNYQRQYEILIIDDGSPTPVESLVNHIGSHIFDSCRFIRSSRNNGIAHALNYGLSIARFPLIARLDADDCWRASKIELQLSAFEADPDLSICATGMNLVDEYSNIIEPHVRAGQWPNILHFAAHIGCPFPHGSVLARTDVFRLVGGYSHDTALNHCEDYALWGTWLRFFKPTMIEQLLFDYMLSASSVSGRHRQQQIAASDRVAMDLKRTMDPATLPATLEAFRLEMGCSLLDAGRLAYVMWRYSPCVQLPQGAVQPLKALLPDRTIAICDRDRGSCPWHLVGIPLEPGRRFDVAVRAYH